MADEGKKPKKTNEMRTIKPSAGVKAELEDWIKQNHDISDWKTYRKWINKLSNCLLFGIIDKPLYSALMYGAQMLGFGLAREHESQGGGATLVEMYDNRKISAKLTREQLREYLSESNTEKRIQLLNRFANEGHVVVDVEVEEVPLPQLTISTTIKESNARDYSTSSMAPPAVQQAMEEDCPI